MFKSVKCRGGSTTNTVFFSYCSKLDCGDQTKQCSNCYTYHQKQLSTNNRHESSGILAAARFALER